MASTKQSRLAAAAAARDAARAALSQRLTALKPEVTPAGLRRRVVADLKYRAQEAGAQAVEIASDNRGVLIGTLAVAGVWLLRKPLAKAAMAALQRIPIAKQKPDS